jgi:hypothetical protein
MTHFRLRYVQAFVDRKTGAVFQYFRRPGFPRVRLPGLPGSSEFMTAYQAALAGPRLEIGTSRSKPGSIAAAASAYLVSPEFTTQSTTGRLARGTQVMRRAILQRLRDQYGDHPIGPTQAGERLLQTIGPRFEEIDAEVSAVRDLREKPAGTIRITATEYAADAVLLPKLAKLLPK